MQFKSCPSVHGAETSRLSRNIRAFIISFYQKNEQKKQPSCPRLLPPVTLPQVTGVWSDGGWGGGKGRVGGGSIWRLRRD